jgi:RhoGAP domain
MSQHSLGDDIEVRVIPRELRLEAPYEFQFTLSIHGNENVYAAPSEGELVEWIHSLSRGHVTVPWIAEKTFLEEEEEDGDEDENEEEDDEQEEDEKQVQQESASPGETASATGQSGASRGSRRKRNSKGTRTSTGKGKNKGKARRTLFGSMPNRESYRRFLEPLQQQLQRNAPVVDLLFGAEDHNVSTAVEARAGLEQAYAADRKELVLSHVPPPTLAGLLLLYLYQMPRPLIPEQLFFCFMGAHSIHQPQHKVTVLRKLVYSLPKYSAKVLDGLFYFVHRVELNNGGSSTAPAEVPSMWTQTLAQVLGPLVMRPPPDQPTMWKSAEEHSSLLIEFASCRYTQLFCETPEEEMSAAQVEASQVSAESKQTAESAESATARKKSTKKGSHLAGTVRENYALYVEEGVDGCVYVCVC